MHTENDPTLSFIRNPDDKTKVSRLRNSHPAFSSQEGKYSVEKRAVIVPVQVRRSDVFIGGTTSWADNIIDEETRLLVSQGAFFTTEFNGSLQDTNPKYALLMHQNTWYPENAGRGGVLMKQAESGFEPVLLSINGYEYVLDLKGTGTPTGILDEKTGSGVVYGEAAEEFHSMLQNLQQSAKNPWNTFPISHVYFDKKFIGQLARAVPVTYRPSYKNGDAEKIMTEMSEVQKTKALFTEISRYLAFYPPRVATNHWLDNVYYINGEPQTMIATDFMDIEELHQSREPWHKLEVGLETAFEGSPKCDIGVYLEAISEGIRSVNPNIEVNWKVLSTNIKTFTPKIIAQAIMESFLAESIFKAQLESGITFSRSLVAYYVGEKEMQKIEKSHSFDFNFLIKYYLSDQIKIRETVLSSRSAEQELKTRAEQELPKLKKALRKYELKDILDSDNEFLFELEQILGN